MKLPVKRIAQVKQVANEAALSEDVALRTFAISCLNMLSDVRRFVSDGDSKSAEQAMNRAERMAQRIRSGQAGSVRSGENEQLTIDGWRDPQAVKRVLNAVRLGERTGTLIGTTELREHGWPSDEDLLLLIDELFSAGYLLGKPRRGEHPHFFEYSELRLGLRAGTELEES